MEAFVYIKNKNYTVKINYKQVILKAIFSYILKKSISYYY